MAGDLPEPPSIRQLADEKGVIVDCEWNTIVQVKKLPADPQFMAVQASVGNQAGIWWAIGARQVFRKFTDADWRRVLDNWSGVSDAISTASIPQGYPYDFDFAETVFGSIERLGLRIRAKRLLSGEDVPPSILNGGFSPSELLKLVEFMAKTRVIRFKGRVREWHGVDEAVEHILFAKTRPDVRFWYETLGEGIIDNMFVWIHQVDPDARLAFGEDFLTFEDTATAKQINDKIWSLLRHFKDAGIPVSDVHLQNNLWIYTAPSKEHIVEVLGAVKELGYGLAAPDTTVNMSDREPFWMDRRPLRSVTDPLQEQAKVYKDVCQAYLEMGADFGIGGFNDATSWFGDLGHPETKAMIMDENLQPKPAYHALIDALSTYPGRA